MCILYGIAGDFCRDFILANWRISYEVAKILSAKKCSWSHGSMPENRREYEEKIGISLYVDVIHSNTTF